jgi:hypothetical protein
MLKAVCVEAGMIALRTGKNKIGHEHYVDAITEGMFPTYTYDYKLHLLTRILQCKARKRKAVSTITF